MAIITSGIASKDGEVGSKNTEGGEDGAVTVITPITSAGTPVVRAAEGIAPASVTAS